MQFGAFSLLVALGLRSILTNLMAGIQVRMQYQMRPGMAISFAMYSGVVKEMRALGFWLENAPENSTRFVPFSQLNDSVVAFYKTIDKANSDPNGRQLHAGHAVAKTHNRGGVVGVL